MYISVIMVPEVICQPSIMVDITAPSGVLSSVVTDDTELGSATCPWVIKAQPGQRNNITLMDFSTHIPLDGACQAYAIVREKRPTHSQTICRDRVRERHVYLSQGPTLEVRLIRSSNHNMNHFILIYQSK